MLTHHRNLREAKTLLRDLDSLKAAYDTLRTGQRRRCIRKTLVRAACVLVASAGLLMDGYMLARFGVI